MPFIIKEETKDKRIWPASIFALSRILKVKGRIIHLNLSINTKILNKIKGEPFGEIWLVIILTFCLPPHIIIEIKTLIEMKRSMYNWEENAKIFGNKLIKLKFKIKKKSEKIDTISPLGDICRIEELNSLLMKKERNWDLKNILWKLRELNKLKNKILIKNKDTILLFRKGKNIVINNFFLDLKNLYFCLN